MKRALWIVALFAANRLNLPTQSTGITVQLNGTTVGSASSINLQSGIGVVWSCTPGSTITCSATFGAGILSKPQFTSGVCEFLNSTNGTSAYTASLAGCQVLTSYTAGKAFLLRVDVPNSFGSCSLNIDGVGLRNIKQRDGVTDLGPNQLIAGQFYWIVYDGIVFRLM